MRKHDWYSDTDPKALEVFLECQRKMSPSEKIAAVFQMNEFLRGLTESRERQLHPDADDREIFLRVAAHHLDRETMLRVYGWYPPRDHSDESRSPLADARGSESSQLTEPRP